MGLELLIMWEKVADLIGEAAPLLGTALGGPGGAAIGGMIASVLGVENKPKAIADTLKNNPDALLKLKAFELENRKNIREVTFKSLQAELNDKANARAAHKDSRMPAIIVFMLTLMAAGLLWALFQFEIPGSNQEVAFYLFGQVVTLWAASITYWVGTTRSSADKNKIMTGLK